MCPLSQARGPVGQDWGTPLCSRSGVAKPSGVSPRPIGGSGLSAALAVELGKLSSSARGEGYAVMCMRGALDAPPDFPWSCPPSSSTTAPASPVCQDKRFLSVTRQEGAPCISAHPEVCAAPGASPLWAPSPPPCQGCLVSVSSGTQGTRGVLPERRLMSETCASRGPESLGAAGGAAPSRRWRGGKPRRRHGRGLKVAVTFLDVSLVAAPAAMRVGDVEGRGSAGQERGGGGALTGGRGPGSTSGFSKGRRSL